jgi:Na+-driven multidrug efflux pump
MTVDGVAIATIVSQYASAVAAVAVLASKKGEPYCFRFKELCIKKAALQRILRLGIPMGLQSTFYSITNLVMVISINTFPTAAVTANTIAGNIDAVTWTVINSFGQATTTFTGQNYGARNPERVKRVIYYGLLQTTVTVILIASGELLLSDLLIKMFLDSTNPENPLIIGYAKEIMLVMLTSYVIFGVVDGSQASMRGLGHSLCPTLITMICICGIRISWILAAAPRFNSLWGLYLAFPLSWVVGGTASVIALVIYYRRFGRKFGAKPEFKDTAVPVSD